MPLKYAVPPSLLGLMIFTNT